MLCLDRTNWQFGRVPIKLLVLSVVYPGVSVPLRWTVLDKKGNSSTSERKALRERLLAGFPVERIECLTADREFRGHQWLSYLSHRGIAFRVRIPNNTHTHNRQRHARLPVTRLFNIRLGETLVLNRPRRWWGHPLSVVGTRACSGEHGIVITTQAPENALEDYKKPWETACLVAVMKRRGFNLEDTPLTDPDRVSRLVAVLTLALCWCYQVGVWLDQKKPIALKKHPRRVCSVVRLGLDTLRHLVLNAASKTTQLHRMIHLLFDKTTSKATSSG